MAKRFRILDSALAAGRPLLENCTVAANRTNMPAVRAAEPEIETNNEDMKDTDDGDTDDTDEPEEYWDPAPDENRASINPISISAIRPVIVTTPLPASVTSTLVPSHISTCLPIRSTARSPIPSIWSLPPPVPLIVATPAAQPTAQLPTTFLTLTVSRELGSLPATTGSIGPDGANPGSTGPQQSGSNLLTVGGSTVLAGAVITAGIFLLVRYAMKVRQRRKRESEGGEDCGNVIAGGAGTGIITEEEEEKSNMGEKNVAVGLGLRLQQPEAVSGPTAAAQTWNQAGAHHAEFL